MPFILALVLVAGMGISYLLFAMPLKTALQNARDDLRESEKLLKQASETQGDLKQKVADLEYQLRDAEKELRSRG
ncbi:MAG: hypothetical protein H7A09_09805 [Oceanospirillaceae bacterium]|nr:hypothetical protein [Oceanospirillaceae bacterium]MCP5335166.1 hypothetical protein [Oceanospirillaceae bacterium]MCP5351502.1 hypothetical protein [Oceanospirillaceae bacterium]